MAATQKSKLSWNDIGYARRLAESHPQRIRFVQDKPSYLYVIDPDPSYGLGKRNSTMYLQVVLLDLLTKEVAASPAESRVKYEKHIESLGNHARFQGVLKTLELTPGVDRVDRAFLASEEWGAAQKAHPGRRWDGTVGDWVDLEPTDPGRTFA